MIAKHQQQPFGFCPCLQLDVELTLKWLFWTWFFSDQDAATQGDVEKFNSMHPSVVILGTMWFNMLNIGHQFMTQWILTKMNQLFHGTVEEKGRRVIKVRIIYKMGGMLQDEVNSGS